MNRNGKINETYEICCNVDLAFQISKCWRADKKIQTELLQIINFTRSLRSSKYDVRNFLMIQILYPFCDTILHCDIF